MHYYRYPDSEMIVETKDLSKSTGTYFNKAEGRRLQEAYYLKCLREIVQPGTTVYVIVRSVARSGMSRKLSLFNSKMQNITYQAGIVLGCRSEGAEITVRGCGMDMCFATVYALGRALFPEGFGTEGTLERDSPTPLRARAVNTSDLKVMKRVGYKFQGLNGDTSGWDNDGGYALRHVTL